MPRTASRHGRGSLPPAASETPRHPSRIRAMPRATSEFVSACSDEGARSATQPCVWRARRLLGGVFSSTRSLPLHKPTRSPAVHEGFEREDWAGEGVRGTDAVLAHKLAKAGALIFFICPDKYVHKGLPVD